MIKSNKNDIYTQEELCEALHNMIEYRVEDSETVEELKFCLEVAIEEWQEVYSVTMTGG